jgi:hypothetical protein
LGLKQFYRSRWNARLFDMGTIKMTINTKHTKLESQAQLARERFAVDAPRDAPPLPLSHGEREDLKAGGLPHIVAWYARSLEGRDYDTEEHPSFADFAQGVMASDFAPDFIKDVEELQGRFPPRSLSGLGPGLYWQPPKLHAQTMASLERSLARIAA